MDHPDPKSHRNIFGVAPYFGDDRDLHASKAPHTMRLRDDPTTGRPGVTMHFR